MDPENKKHYLGKACKKCDGKLRYVTTNLCVPCKLASSKAWNKANPGYAKYYAIEWRAHNRGYLSPAQKAKRKS